MQRIACYGFVFVMLCGLTEATAQKKGLHLRPTSPRSPGISFSSGAAVEQWQMQTALPGAGAPLTQSIKAANRQVAWASSPTGTVYRTTDGGNAWRPTAASVTSTEDLSCIEALDSTTAFVGGGGQNSGGGNAKIYRTQDGGKSWQAVYTATGPNSFWDGIKFFDAQNGIALSDPPIANGAYLIVKTTDGGTTWAPIANPPLAQQNEFGLQHCFYFYDKLNGWFGTIPAVQNAKAGRVFHTTDGGDTWSGVAAGNEVSVLDVCFISPTVGIRTSGAAPILARSTDGGVTWTPVTNLPIVDIQYVTPAICVSAGGRHQIWVYGESGAFFTPFIVSSSDGGVTWQQQTVADIGVHSFYHISAVSFGAANDSVRAWAITVNYTSNPPINGGRILTYLDRIGGTTAVKERTEIPAEYSLAQNYPNPFWSGATSPAQSGGNPATKIEFRIAALSLVTLKVYDVMGREVATLINAKLQPGRYEAKLEAGHLSAGLYFYRLQAGNFTATQKMILAK